MLFVMSWIPYHFWKKISLLLLGASMVLLVLVFVPGIGADFGTAKSWILIAGNSVQPSEIVKLTFLLYLSAWFEGRAAKGVKSMSTGLLPFVGILGVIMLLMILQPDIGTMSVIVAMSLAVYFAAGAPLLHLLSFGAAGIGAFYALIKFAPYRAARFTTFLHPELDPQGIGYHINQALLAVGSGGLLGLGYGHSRQKFQYLPEVAGDSVFAVVAEELGFLLSSAVIIGYVFLARRILRIATLAPDKFGQFVGVGVAAWLIFQSFINIGAMLGLLPITGVPLPLVSFGGTSLVTMLSALGIVLNISKYRKQDS
jgi:cell division protein FtsW